MTWNSIKKIEFAIYLVFIYRLLLRVTCKLFTDKKYVTRMRSSLLNLFKLFNIPVMFHSGFVKVARVSWGVSIKNSPGCPLINEDGNNLEKFVANQCSHVYLNKIIHL